MRQCSGGGQGRRAFRKWRQSQRDLCYDSQGTKGTHKELAHVVAGNVFDHLAAGFDLLAGRERHFHADHEVADATVKHPARPIKVRGDYAADGGTGRMRRIEWQELILRRECLLQTGEGDATLNRRRQVGVVMLDHAVEMAQF